MSKRINEFESLRGIAALWVAASHILLIAEISIPVLSSGGIAVDLFIILSGFVIALMRIQKSEPYTIYLTRRFFRLYPLFLVALVLGIMTSHLYPVVIGQSFWGGPELPAFLVRKANEQASFWMHLGLHLTMLHGAVPDTVLPQAALAFSGPLWSISLEWQFYIIAPLLIWALDLRFVRSWVTAPISLIITVALFLLSQGHWHAEVPSLLFLRLPLFCFGILCAVCWTWAQNINRAIVATLLVISWFALGRLYTSELAVSIWSATYFLASGTQDGLNGAARRLLTAKPLVWIGQRSFGLYVLHMPIVLFAGSLLAPAMPSIGKLATSVALASVVGFVVLPIADAVYRVIELPANRWARSLGSKGRIRAEIIGPQEGESPDS